MGSNQSLYTEDISPNVQLGDILKNPDVSPTDAMSICNQPGNTFSGGDPSVGRTLMNHFYPGILKNNEDPWKEFVVLTTQKESVFSSFVPLDTIENMVKLANYPDVELQSNILFPLTESKLNPDLDAYDDNFEIYHIVMSGYPRFGKFWVSGSFDEFSGSSLKIFYSKELAMEDLFDHYIEMIQFNLDEPYDDNDLYIAGDIPWDDKVALKEYFYRIVDEYGYIAIHPLPTQDMTRGELLHPEMHYMRYWIIFHIGEVEFSA